MTEDKTKVKDLATELGVPTKNLLQALRELDIPAKSTSSNIAAEDIDRVKNHLKDSATSEQGDRREVQPGVIVRRRRQSTEDVAAEGEEAPRAERRAPRENHTPTARIVSVPGASEAQDAAPVPSAEPEAPAAPEVSVQEPVKDAAEEKPAQVAEADKADDQKPRQPQQAEKPAVPAEPKVYAPAEPGSREERIEIFIKGLLEHMGSDAVPHAVKTGDDTYLVDLVGENLGILIGRRGETLDAIQHLTNYAVNRGQNKRVRINVDAESYRLKREQALQRLAQKVAGKVTRYRRNITLEPMNAYERHVIHAALQDYPDVTTFSTGTEPNRRIVVAYSRYKSAEAAVKKDFPETEEE